MSIIAALDTNIWLSAIFWEGEADKLAKKIEEKKIKVVVSREVLSEITEVLNKEEKFQKFLKNKEKKIEDVVRTILFIADLISIKSDINIINEHPDDNKILELAKDGNADYIVSYDNHLLKLNKFKSIKIVEPGTFIKMLKSK